MISRDTIQKIIEAGAQAPSGSNSQPWRFEVSGSDIAVYMLPEKDHPILNFRHRGTILANGCLLENMAVAADHFGALATVSWFPDASDRNLVARVSIKDHIGNQNGEGLFGAIFRRATNRKPYGKKPIPESIKKILSSEGIRFIEDEEKIAALAEAASTNEIVMFENQTLHKLFFEELAWTEQEEQKRGGGLYLPTMELQPPQRAALKLFRKWGFMKFMNRLVHAARGIAGGNAKNYAACGAYGIIMCDDDDRAFGEAGRVIERAWLKATAAGLSFHLQTGVNFLWMRLMAEGIPGITAEHAELIKKSYATIAEIAVAPPGKIVPAIFRIGFGGEPSARSMKKAPEVVYH